MLAIKFDGNSYVAKLSIDQKPTVIRAGFLWNDLSCEWEGNARQAYRLLDFADSPTQKHLLTELKLNLFSVPQIEYPKNRGFTPFEHQLEGARWVLSRRASYIAFEAGLGKTLIAPLCMNTSSGPTIIVCPSFLKLNWEDELERGLIDFHHIQILNKQSDKLNPNADVYIVPDSLLHVHEFRDQFFKMNRRFKYMFVDEAHRFKSADARRTMSLVGRRDVKLGKGKNARHVSWKGFHHIADRVVNLSGTPMPNRPLELYPLISKHAPHALNYLDPHRYGVQFCGGYEAEYGWDYTGNSNLEELHKILSRNYMIVKRKRDCLDMPKKLPPKVIYIQDDRGSLKKDEMILLQKMKITDIIAIETARNAKFKQRVEDMLEDNPNMGGFGFISELRKMLGLSKVNACVKAIKEIMEDRDKLVVFCWHTEVANELCEQLSEFNPLKIIGKVKTKDRHNIVKAFQNNPKHRIIVLNIQAGGVGITLTRSSLVAFVERSWVPAENDQAFDRIDRIGQDEEVESISFIVKNSLDHLLLNAHLNKNEVIKTAIKPST
jgi:SWI/SNF-related matrix-associated actin-dependent regulator 1 of chromatin subfamily A